MSSTAAARKNREFDPNTFLAMIGDARKILAVPKKQTSFTQGDELGKARWQARLSVWDPRLQ